MSPCFLKAATCMGMAGLAYAASAVMASADQTTGEIALNVPGATTPAPPPASFDPLRASDAALAQYGYPPRPDAVASPAGYASWAKAMGAIRTRIIPELRVTNIRHRPNMSAPLPGPRVVAPGAGATEAKTALTSYSDNWSGYVNTNSLSAFNPASSFSFISADYVVPLVRNATCDKGWDYSSQWIGIDGWTSNDVLQGGTETDAYCSNFFTSTYYSPWYEWYPNNETEITNLTISAGDDIFVEIWAESATKGKFFIENLNQGAMATITFSAPQGTRLIGNSAEWIVERPEVSNKLATLANYTADYFSGAAAQNFANQSFAPGANEVDMLVGSTVVSKPALLGARAFLFDYQ